MLLNIMQLSSNVKFMLQWILRATKVMCAAANLMAVFHYLQPGDELPDSKGSLPSEIPPAIAQVNREVHDAGELQAVLTV